MADSMPKSSETKVEEEATPTLEDKIASVSLEGDGDDGGGGSNNSVGNEEIFLDEEGWREEAQGVIRDVREHVGLIEVADALKPSCTSIYLNLTTLEGRHLTVELTAQGFQIVGASGHDQIDRAGSSSEDDGEYYETPYALLNSVSDGFRLHFGQTLFDKLAVVKRAREADEALKEEEEEEED